MCDVDRDHHNDDISSNTKNFPIYVSRLTILIIFNLLAACANKLSLPPIEINTLISSSVKIYNCVWKENSLFIIVCDYRNIGSRKIGRNQIDVAALNYQGLKLTEAKAVFGDVNPGEVTKLEIQLTYDTVSVKVEPTKIWNSAIETM